jgi:hypothetical protein
MAGLKAKAFWRYDDYHDGVMMCSTLEHTISSVSDAHVLNSIMKTFPGCDICTSPGSAQTRAQRQHRVAERVLRHADMSMSQG